MAFEKIMYKGKELKMDETAKSIILYVQKNNPNRLDMRFKSNKDYLRMIQKPWWYCKLQWLADHTGGMKHGFLGAGISWKHWFSPRYHLHRLLWKLGDKNFYYGKGAKENV